MTDVSLTDNQWTKIRDFLKQDPNAYVKWMSRSGAQWRLLPPEYGNWNSVFKRFRRWCERSVWERMLDHFADDPDMESGMVDSTIVRAHPCVAGAEKNVGNKRLDEVAGALPPKSM